MSSLAGVGMAADAGTSDQWTAAEVEALEKAGEEAGQYLDQIGKSDIAKITVDQWETLIERVICGYQDKLCEIHRDGPMTYGERVERAERLIEGAHYHLSAAVKMGEGTVMMPVSTKEPSGKPNYGKTRDGYDIDDEIPF